MKIAALKMAESYGFSVFPVRPRQKTPLITNWPQLATKSPVKIAEWWDEFPDANIGVVTGPKSGVFVLDVDGEAGHASLEQLKKQSIWPDTLTVKTGSGGLHFYFRWDESNPLRNSASKIAPGLDIRGAGGYVVAPPSIHPNGQRYEWI